MPEISKEEFGPRDFAAALLELTGREKDLRYGPERFFTFRHAILAALRLAASASSPEPEEWLPIETAPKDTDFENTIDLWIVRNGRGYRVVNCRETYSEKGTWIGPDGKWVTGGRYYDETGREFFSPRPIRPNHGTATHWRPLPAPPSSRHSDGERSR